MIPRIAADCREPRAGVIFFGVNQSRKLVGAAGVDLLVHVQRVVITITITATPNRENAAGSGVEEQPHEEQVPPTLKLSLLAWSQ